MSNQGCYKGTQYETTIFKLAKRKRSDNTSVKCPNCSIFVYSYDGLKRHIEATHPSDVQHKPMTKRMKLSIQEQKTEEPIFRDLSFDDFLPEEVYTNESGFEGTVLDNVKGNEFFKVLLFYVFVKILIILLLGINASNF